MKRIFLLMLFIYLQISLNAKIIAEVGNHTITKQELEAEIENIYKDANYDLSGHVEEEALNRLIEAKALLTFAEKNQFKVTDSELEAFFIKQLGNHPKFKTNGIFDYFKFEQLKETDEKIQNILAEMRRDLVINKAKSVIKSQFDINDEELLQEYIKDNTKVDLSYIVFDEETVNVPFECTVENAYEFYKSREKFSNLVEKYKYDFIYIKKKDLYEFIKVSEQDLVDEFNSASYMIPFNEIKDSLHSIILERKAGIKLDIVVNQIADKWKNNQFFNFPIITSNYLSEKSTFGNFNNSKEILGIVSKMNIGEVSEPIKVEEGYLIIKLLDKKKEYELSLEEDGEKIWKSYVNYIKSDQVSDKYKRYYQIHIEDFIAPAAFVKKIIIDPEYVSAAVIDEQEKNDVNAIIYNKKNSKIDNVIKYIKDNFENKQILKRFYSVNKIITEQNIIYLAKHPNESTIDQKLSSIIRNNKNEYSGKVKVDDKVVLYTLENYFPSYIPAFESVENQIYQNYYINSEVNVSDATLKEYYIENHEQFLTKDSLKIGGAFFPIITDSIDVSEKRMRDYFERNKERYFAKSNVEFSSIYVHSQKIAEKIYEDMKKDYDFSLLKEIYNQYTAPFDGKTEYSSLPDTLTLILQNSAIDSVAAPVHFENGWMIVKKIGESAAKQQEFEEAYDDVLEDIRFEIADSIAKSKANDIFLKYEYFGSCKLNVASENFFQTELKSIDQDFYPIEKIAKYRNDLMRLYKNQKYDKVIKNKNGYAVVYLLEKRKKEQLSFYEAYERVVQSFEVHMKGKYAKKYIERVLNKVEKHKIPEKYLDFFGGLKHLQGITLNDQIADMPYSKIILQKILKMNVTEFSRPIKIENNKYITFRADQIKKADKENFDIFKDDYKDYFIDSQYDKWLNSFIQEIGISKKIINL